jgi:hypothetical protein
MINSFEACDLAEVRVRRLGLRRPAEYFFPEVVA